MQFDPFSGVCVCNSGFIGNGHDCRMICAMNEMFNGVSCVKLQDVEEGKMTLYILKFKLIYSKI